MVINAKMYSLSSCVIWIHRVVVAYFSLDFNENKIKSKLVSWSGYIVPLFKKGDKALPENSRPISLTSFSCKILEYVVQTSVMGCVMTHLDKHRFLDDAQYGFQKFRSSVSRLNSSSDDFANCLP